MRLIILGILFLSISSHAQDHYLVINPDGHRSSIFDMDIDENGNIVTGSFDKTVKVWDGEKGHLLKEFRGQIGPGSEGMVYAIDVSPNNKFLAVGGWMGKTDESEKLGDVRIYDYQSGKMLKLLTKVHEDVIYSLKFTNDSQYLITGGADGIIVKWEVSTGIPKMVYTELNLGMSNLAVADDYFISTHADGMFYKYDFDKNKPTKKINFFEKLEDLNVSSIGTISKDGEWIAIGGKQIGMVLIFNSSFKMKDYFFTGDNTIIDLDFSPNAIRLAVSVKEPSKNRIIVYERSGKKFQELATYREFDATAMCVKFLDNNTVASCGGFNNEIAVWKIKNDKTKQKFASSGVGETFFSAALDGSQLAFGLKANRAYGQASYSKVFDLFSRQFVSLDDSTRFNFPIHEKGDLKIYEKTQVRKTDWDPNEILYLTKNGKELAQMLRYPWDGNVFRSFSFIGDKYIVSGGDYGILTAYDYEGNVQSKFVGHEDAISSVNTSTDGKFVVTAGYDNTIRLWHLNEIGQQQENPEINSIWEYLKDQYLDDPWHGRILKLNLKKRAEEKSLDAWQEVIEKLNEEGYNTEFLKHQMNWEKANVIYPVVSIFIGTNDEWIIWNNEGYFTSSRKGARYVGYHVNHGKKKEAGYYPFDQFDLKYNRPDIIYKELEMADAGILDLYYKAYLKRLKRMGLSEEDLASDILAPDLKIKQKSLKGGTAEILIEAKDDKYLLDRVNVFINDVPIYGRDGISVKELAQKEISQSIQLELINGENKVQVSVLNEIGVESLKETLYLTNTTNTQSDLYVISLGVSKYKDKKYDLNYAAKDAEDISNAFDENQVYQNVHQLVLTDENVTREKIYGIADFLKAAKTNDIVLMFIAGHGVLDKNLDYFYCTHDIDFLDPAGRGVSYGELEALFDGIKAIRKLLIMDTCHSGELDKDEVVEVEVIAEDNEDLVFRSGSTSSYTQSENLKQTNEAVKEMFNDLNRGTGTTVISSAGGAEFAMESDEWKNGLFTYCLLKGIKSKKADLNGDGKIFISELQEFIRQEVVRLSQGKQSPSSRFENISLDYQIW